jgi:DNA polymerase/3'-5' exonuclease PolX
MSGKRKRAADGNMNEEIVDALTELAEWERNSNRNTYKANAYAKAAAAIGSLDYRCVFCHRHNNFR